MSAIQQVLSGFNSSRNYATRNPLDKDASITLSNGNLTATGGGVWWRAVRGTIGKSSGKRYWEISGLTWANRIIGVGNSSAGLSTYVGGDVNGWGYSQAPLKYNNNSGAAYGTAFGSWDVIWVALDMTAGTITMYKNNVSQWTMYTGLTGTLFPMISEQWVETMTANFGATALTYTPPVGFNAGLYT